MSSLMMVSRKEELESLRTRRGLGLGLGWESLPEREERMSRLRRSLSRRSRSEENPARRKEGRKDEDRLALRAEEERDKSGDGSEDERDSCVGDVVEPGVG